MKAGKAIHTLSLLVAAFALLVITVPVMASETDDRIESAAQDTVESQPGVKSVDNRLEVKGEHSPRRSRMRGSLQK